MSHKHLQPFLPSYAGSFPFFLFLTISNLWNSNVQSSQWIRIQKKNREKRNLKQTRAHEILYTSFISNSFLATKKKWSKKVKKNVHGPLKSIKEMEKHRRVIKCNEIQDIRFWFLGWIDFSYIRIQSLTDESKKKRDEILDLDYLRG